MSWLKKLFCDHKWEVIYEETDPLHPFRTLKFCHKCERRKWFVNRLGLR